MPIRTSEASQRLAARIAGFSLLLLIASGIFGGFVLQNHIIVSDVAQTAQNLLAHERRYRLGVLCEMLMFNCDIILALALYALLKPVNSTLALLGSFWRIANAIVLGAGVAGTFVALDLLSDAQHITAFTTPSYTLLRPSSWTCMTTAQRSVSRSSVWVPPFIAIFSSSPITFHKFSQQHISASSCNSCFARSL